MCAPVCVGVRACACVACALRACALRACAQVPARTACVCDKESVQPTEHVLQNMQLELKALVSNAGSAAGNEFVSLHMSSMPQPVRVQPSVPRVCACVFCVFCWVRPTVGRSVRRGPP